MTVITTLMQSGHIKPGTWLGIRTRTHVRQMVVTQVSPPDVILVSDPQDLTKYKVRCDHICEVEGMQLHRYLAQADLNPDGTPIQNLTRRGRKRKIRS